VRYARKDNGAHRVRVLGRPSIGSIVICSTTVSPFLSTKTSRKIAVSDPKLLSQMIAAHVLVNDRCPLRKNIWHKEKECGEQGVWKHREDFRARRCWWYAEGGGGDDQGSDAWQHGLPADSSAINNIRRAFVTDQLTAAHLVISHI
jgi:hypothetical protein